MRPAAALAIALATLGLAAFRYPTVVDAPAPAAAPSFTITDGRPEDQTKSEFESLMITNCAYGAVRVGGRDISPEPLALVRDGLAARANSALAGRQVVLSNLTIHLNNAIGLRAQVGAMHSGLIPDLMNKRDKVGCAHDDLRGGYTLGEIDGTPLITVIDVTVDGKEHHARCIVPSPVAYPPLKRHKAELHVAWNKAATEQVGCALDMLAAQINAGAPVAFAHAEKRLAEERKARSEANSEAQRCARARMSGWPCKKKAPEVVEGAETPATPEEAVAPTTDAVAPEANSEAQPAATDGPAGDQVAQDPEMPA